MDLIEQIRKGDREAIKQVYKENSKEVLEFAESITGDHESAMEVTKKTFVKLFSSIQGGESPLNIRLSALKIAHDEACKVAMPSNELLVSPYDEADSEIGKLEQAVGHDDKDEAMGETRVISLPQEAIDELVDDTTEEPARIEDVGNEELHGDSTVHIPTDYIDHEAKKRGYDDQYEEDDRRRSRQRDDRRRDTRYEDDRRYDDRRRHYDDRYDDDDYYEEDDYYYDNYDKPRKKRSGGVFAVCLIINIILILLLLWFVAGLLINLGVIPDYDLGYTWFNAHIADIF